MRGARTSDHDDVLACVQHRLVQRGASRDALLREAFTDNAPHHVIRALHNLPDTYVTDSQDLRAALDHPAGAA